METLPDFAQISERHRFSSDFQGSENRRKIKESLHYSSILTDSDERVIRLKVTARGSRITERATMRKPEVVIESDGTLVVTTTCELRGRMLNRLDLRDGDTLMLKIRTEFDGKRLAKSIERNLAKAPNNPVQFRKWLRTAAQIAATEGLKEVVKSAASWLPHAG
jgi:ribosomal protein L28